MVDSLQNCAKQSVETFGENDEQNNEGTTGEDPGIDRCFEHEESSNFALTVESTFLRVFYHFLVLSPFEQHHRHEDFHPLLQSLLYALRLVGFPG